jgi:hypothetical protein
MRVDLFQAPPQSLRGGPGLCRDLLVVDSGRPAILDHHLTIDHHVPDQPSLQPEQPVPGQVRFGQRGRFGVLQHHQVGRRPGLQVTHARLVEELGGQPSTFGQSPDRPGRRRGDVVLSAAKVGGAGFGEHVAVDPVGAQRHTRAQRGDRCPPHRVVHVRAGVVGNRDARVPHQLHLGPVQVDAVRQERSGPEGAGARQTLHDSLAEPGLGIALIGRVLCHVDVDARVCLAGNLDAAGERLR